MLRGEVGFRIATRSGLALGGAVPNCRNTGSAKLNIRHRSKAEIHSPTADRLIRPAAPPARRHSNLSYASSTRRLIAFYCSRR